MGTVGAMVGSPAHGVGNLMVEADGLGRVIGDRSVAEVAAYTDGACRGNPGPGGYGVVLVCGKARKELSGGRRRTTNNRMELLAAIKALEALTQRCAVTLYTDSEYVARGINEGWALRWRAKGWRISANKPAKNPDLWADLLDQLARHAVSVRWVKGHADVPENNHADQLAVAAAAGSALPPDEGYDRPQSAPQASTIGEGHPCFKCRTPVVKQAGHKRLKPGQTYYYEWVLYCPGCQATYMIEAAKRTVDRGPELNLGIQ